MPRSHRSKLSCATASSFRSSRSSKPQKATFDTRPIFHSDDAAIRGHVFCSFLALVLQKELADRCEAAGLRPEWAEVLRDLDRLQQATIDKDGKRITTRTAVSGQVGSLFKAAGVALPPNMREQTAA